MHAKGMWKYDLMFLLAILAMWLIPSGSNAAGYEEVQIINVETINVVSCPNGQGSSSSAQGQGLAGTGVTGTQVLGTVTGAAVGAWAGGELAGPKHRTTGQVLGGLAGAGTGYAATGGLTTAVPPSCQEVPRYKVTYKRVDGSTGILIRPDRTTAKSMMINFCPGKQGQLERPC